MTPRYGYDLAMPRPCTRLLLCALLVILGSWSAQPAQARDAGERDGVASATARALEGLRHPLAGERERAIAMLVKGLPGTREAVITAIAEANATVRPLLARVLARDDSTRAVQVLFDVMGKAGDSEAVRIGMAIVEDRTASVRVLRALQATAGRTLREEKSARGRRLQGMYELVQRADIEQRFLAHKSTTGGTGYYRGQYDDLLPDRKAALEILVSIALDEAMPVLGVYRTGHYTFLRPRAIEFWEVRDMAINAVSELGRTEDERVILRLQIHASRLERRVWRMWQRLRSMGSWRRDEAEELEEELSIMVGRWIDTLTAVYLIRRDARSRRPIDRFIAEDSVQIGNAMRRLPWWRESTCAGLSIRAGWYEDAILWYERVLARTRLSRSTAYYNIACAYASWSRDVEGAERRQKQDSALRNLEYAVAEGWTDLGWMEQDGDLDPIRETPRYRAMVANIEKQLGLR
jgi:hypothetical protein